MDKNRSLNPLTASSPKSSWLLVLFLLFVIFLSVYAVFFRTPSVASNFQQMAFKLTFDAFRSAVFHAHLKVLKQSSVENYQCKIDCWTNKTSGLDYNSKGYPVTTRVSSLSAGQTNDFPKEAIDCVLVWRFLLGPLQTDVSTNNQSKNYQASLISPKTCRFIHPTIPDKAIHYNSHLGTVKFVKNTQ